MSAPDPDISPAEVVIADAKSDFSNVSEWIKHHVHRHATPYHMMVASVLGTITVVFFTVIALLIMVALNFNLLSLIE